MNCAPTKHITMGWFRSPEAVERVHAKERLAEFETRELLWWEQEQLEYIQATGRHHIWRRECIVAGCGWVQCTTIDPKDPNHDQRTLLDEVK